MTATTDLIEKMLVAAEKIAAASPDGALHIFIADGNCENEHIEWCMEQPDITTDEMALCRWMYEEISEHVRFGAWALAQTLSENIETP